MNRRESKNQSFFRDAVIGFGDGMIIPFALAAALTYIDVPAKDVILISLIVIFAGSVLMAIAGFFSGQELKHPGNNHHHHEDLDLPEELKLEVAKEKEEEIKFMESINPEETANPYKSALVIGLFHLIGGLISLLPYFVMKQNSEALSVSFSVMPLFLFATGYLRHSGPGSKPLPGGFRTMMIGLLTAAGACAVAVLFRV